MACNSTRICVLMMNSPNIDKYAHKAVVANYMYVSKYGYSFIVETCPKREDMIHDWMWDEQNEYVFVWSKPTLVKRHLPNYDYVLFIDSDAYFHDTNKRIEEFIDKHFTSDDICIVGGEDCQSSDKCYNKDNMNAGVMMFKNNNQTINILNEWINAPFTSSCEKWKYVHPREQACFNELMHNHNGKHIKLIDFKEMNSIDGVWIKHLMGTTSQYRNKVIGDAMQSALKQLEGFTNPNNMSADTNDYFKVISIFGITVFALIVLIFIVKKKHLF